MGSLPLANNTAIVVKTPGSNDAILIDTTVRSNINSTVLHDHNYAARPTSASALFFSYRNKKSVSSGEASTCLMSAPLLRSEIDRLNNKVTKQIVQLVKCRDEIAVKTRELTEYVNKLVEMDRLKANLELEVKEKTELQDKFRGFRESVTKVSCGLVVLIKEFKRNFNNKCVYCCCGSETQGVGVKEDDKVKLSKDLDQISELVQDTLKAWVVVDQVIDQEEVEKMEESLSRLKRKKALEGKENLVKSREPDMLPKEEEEVKGEVVVPLKNEVFNHNNNQSKGQDGKGKFLCDVCQLRFYLLSNLKSHQKEVHQIRLSKKQRKSIGCKDCGMIFDYVGQLTKHRKSKSCCSSSEVIIKREVDNHLAESSSLLNSIVAIKYEPGTPIEGPSSIKSMSDRSPSSSPPVLEMITPFSTPSSSVVSGASSLSIPVLEKMDITSIMEPTEQYNQSHSTDIFRRHLGVFCVCGKRFDSQRLLDTHIHHEMGDMSKSEPKIFEDSLKDARPLAYLKIPSEKYVASEPPSTSTTTTGKNYAQRKIPKMCSRVNSSTPKRPRRRTVHKANRKFTCEICPAYYQNVRVLNRHYEDFHKIKDTSELVPVAGKKGKMFNCVVLIKKLDRLADSAQKTSNKTEHITDIEGVSASNSTGQLPWRPIFKKKVKRLKFIKKKERFTCHICQRHFPFYHKLVRHLAIKLHSVGEVNKSNKIIRYDCTPCEKLFSERVDFLRHRIAFHHCFSSIISLKRLISVKKKTEEKIAKMKLDRGPVTRKSSKRSSLSSSSASPIQRTKSPRKQKSENIKRLLPSADKADICLCIGENCENFKANKISCSTCEVLATCPMVLKQHVFEKHHVVSSIPKLCQPCGICFPSKKAFLKHEKAVHVKPKLPTKKSLKKASTSQKKNKTAKRETSPNENFKIDFHRQVPAKGLPCFKCYCGKMFQKKLYLFAHILEANQAKGKLLKCAKCFKKFVGNVHLKVHMTRVHNYVGKR